MKTVFSQTIASANFTNQLDYIPMNANGSSCLTRLTTASMFDVQRSMPDTIDAKDSISVNLEAINTDQSSLCALKSNQPAIQSPLNREADNREAVHYPANKGAKVKVGNMAPEITKKLHILLVTETWLPDVNGVAMSLHKLMNQLADMGHTISLLRPAPNQKSSTSDPNSIISHDIQVKGVPIPRYVDLQFGMPAYFSIKRALKSLKPDVVHIATEGPLGLAALMAAKRSKVAATTGYHTQFHDFSRHFGLGVLARPLMAYFKWMHNTSKATCVPSPKTYDDLDKLGFKRLAIVGRGVDLEQFNPNHRSEALRKKWGAEQHHTVLLMVSRLSPEKGVDVVIQGFKALQANQLQRAVKLVIVGDGPDRERLESLAADCGDDIVFCGSKSGLDLSQHYASADAFVFASQVETFGNVVTEAMASGLPVYAFDDAAAGMLVTPENGGLVSMGDKSGFIEMVAALPKMQMLKKQGLEAAETVSGFSWQRPAGQMLNMFYKAMGLNA